ncbi:MAG: leucyl aminopeptidase [Alphaproteobacteria bacterium]
MFDIIFARMSNRTLRKINVVLVEEKNKLTPAAQQVNEALDGQLLRTLKAAGFAGEKGQVECLLGLDKNEVEGVIALGVGKLAKLDNGAWLKLGIQLAQKLDALKLKDVAILLGELESQPATQAAAQAMTEGLMLGSYRFDTYKSKKKDEATLKRVTLFVDGRSARLLEENMPHTTALIEANTVAREVVNLPPNVVNPQYLAEEAKKLSKLGVKVEVLEEKELTKLGMNLMMAVGKGADVADQPRLIIMKWEGAGKGQPTRAIVGKGVTFDTGGYSLKPSDSMVNMKCDMAGSAAVLGTMMAIAKMKLPLNVVGVMGCAKNMISHNAFTPDDVYKGYNGKTVEVGNTDAEGRMVLADAIAYTVDKYEPTELIDLATLTGACMVALAAQYGGLFSDTDRLANALAKAGDDVGERLWRMPVDDAFLAKSEVADMNNAGSRWGGASIGAVFIKQFIGKTPWAHLDIAGMAFSEKAATPFLPLKGANGYGVRLLVNYLKAEAAKQAELENPKRKRRGRPRKAA